jgi:CPA2 family monovalent cation:H+ antiporter-2
LISQSVYARQAVANIVPLRDTFAAIFFVSLGMLADPRFVVDNVPVIATVVTVIIFAKFLICTLIPWFFGHSFKTALFTGMGLIQIGEFSFILAMMGRTSGIISDYLYSLILVSTIITMILTPFAFTLAPVIYQRLSLKERLNRVITRRPDTTWKSSQIELSGHIVICGYGRVGSILAKVLDRRNFPYLVIDLAPQVISELHSKGIPCIYGDASNAEILAYTQLHKARALVCTYPDYIAVELTARNALRLNPKIDIVARVHRDSDAVSLKGIGVAELVRPEFEASLEITRHTLHRLGLTSVEIQRILTGLREGMF